MVRMSHPFVVYISPSNFFAAGGIFIRWTKNKRSFNLQKMPRSIHIFVIL
jgi:hypothetical protein